MLNALRKLIWYAGAALLMLFALSGLLAAFAVEGDTTWAWILAAIAGIASVVTAAKGKNIGQERKTIATAPADMDDDERTSGPQSSPYYGMHAKELLADHCDIDSLGEEFWHKDPVTERQRGVLDDYGIKYPRSITKGQASLIIDLLFDE